MLPRPTKTILEDFFHTYITNHQTQIDEISTLIAKDIFPHAVIFSGPKGIGKKSLAILTMACLLEKKSFLRKESLNGNEKDTKKKNEKENEHETLAKISKTLNLVQKNNFPDAHFLEVPPDKKEIPVEQVRSLISSLNLTPFSGSSCCGIIDNAEKLNSSSYNALLKTLEEPLQNRYLFLITSRLEKIPPTILSRCITIHFSFADFSLKPASSSAAKQPKQKKATLDINDILATEDEMLFLQKFLILLSEINEDKSKLSFEETQAFWQDLVAAYRTRLINLMGTSRVEEKKTPALTLPNNTLTTSPQESSQSTTPGDPEVRKYDLQNSISKNDLKKINQAADKLLQITEICFYANAHNANKILQLSSMLSPE